MTARADRTALRWGGATHVGRVRSLNEDHYVARPDESLWVVADGMGGHNGGEIASELASTTVGEAFVQHSIDGLIDAVEQANAAVYRAGADDPELTGMGTTVVALAVVDHDESEVLAIANVGDSRCYRFADGQLDQVTTDHSLVAEMVREGSLSPEEAAVHPQRNIVTRVLGVHDEVPVDVFAVDPYPGDRYVLCSDGLFNEVPERTIAGVLRSIDDPTETAEELVHLAVDGGGRDNITVVVVDVVDDDGRTAAASAALAGEPARTGSGPRPSPAYAEDEPPWRRRRSDTAELTALPADDEVMGDELDDADTGRGRRGRHAARGKKQRRLTWRVLLFIVLVVALVGGVVATIQWYGTSAYFVGFDGDQVAIYKGRPGGVLWIEPERVDETDLARDDVPDARVADITDGVEQGSLAEARRYVENVREQAAELAPPTSTTSTTVRPTTTTVPRPTTTVR
ncbi:MAG TPA: Stp1/IreP family PP2C-type Ser/Thr phosphatase [Acidimicrobiales bacterium]|nr:Stp1/IreP family PP2C-type Ser/Thr phosphatase [Acidimicrobiales bacterium]